MIKVVSHRHDPNTDYANVGMENSDGSRYNAYIHVSQLKLRLFAQDLVGQVMTESLIDEFIKLAREYHAATQD